MFDRELWHWYHCRILQSIWIVWRHADPQQCHVCLSTSTLGGDQWTWVIWCDIDILSLVYLVSLPREAMANVLLHGSVAGQAGVCFPCWRW